MAFDPMKDRDYGTSAEIAGRLFEECGGVPRVMALLELSRTRCYALADPDDPAEISYARVAALTRAGGTAAAEHLARLAGGTFLPLPPSEGSEDWHHLAARTAQKSAELTAALLASLGPSGRSPGRVDAGEARELLRHVDGLMTLLAEQHALLEAVARGA